MAVDPWNQRLQLNYTKDIRDLEGEADVIFFKYITEITKAFKFLK